METIGLIAALEQEIRPFLRKVGKYERGKLGPFACYHFNLFNLNCLLVKSGMGIKRATDATQRLLVATKPQFLVSFGVAGAVNNDLEIGDVILGKSACSFEGGTLNQFQPLAQLSAGSHQAANRALESDGAKIVSGAIITIQGSTPTLAYLQKTPHLVLEMETAGIARVAAEWRISLLALREVSDTIAEPMPFEIADFFDEDVNPRKGKIISTIIQHPTIIISFLRLSRNVNKAAENLATVLVATLSQPFPIFLP
jgi:adenosylhomocysteine nucleosidase